MEYTVDLYEDPDRWSFWQVIEWREEYDPISDNVSKYGYTLHQVRGNDRFAEAAAYKWLENYKKENGL